MAHDLCDPLEEYKAEYKQKFRDTARTTFDDFTRRSGVDIAANRATCAEIYDYAEHRKRVFSKIGRVKMLRNLLWVTVMTAIGFGLYGYAQQDSRIIVCAIMAVVVILMAIYTLVKPKLKELYYSLAEIDNSLDELAKEAWQQMSALNALYSRSLLKDMIQMVVPWMEFDSYCSTSRVEEFVDLYDWDLRFHDDKSVIFVHTGEINGNPFAIMRTRHQEWTEKVYDGYRTVYWTERSRDSNGRYTTVRRSETLHATYTAPYPKYIEQTRLIYGNSAAPDLRFTREKNEKDYTTSLFGGWGRKRKLKKLSRDMSRDFVKIDNDDFEILFFTSERNHSQQYMLLFTPLAQQNMLNLLRDKSLGYGDDFSFIKDGKINIIISDHAQTSDMEMNPELFHSFDYDQAKEKFMTLSQELFRMVYFAFAPLMAVPEYRQNRGKYAIYGRKGSIMSSFWEHEIMANRLGDYKFKHPDCDTDCVLKTTCITGPGAQRTVSVKAKGYKAIGRVAHVSVWCTNGRCYDVPVDWYEYLPVEGSGSFTFDEHTEFGSRQK